VQLKAARVVMLEAHASWGMLQKCAAADCDVKRMDDFHLCAVPRLSLSLVHRPAGRLRACARC
jgi:hypothetical protein